MNIGQRIKELRLIFSKKQEELAEMLGIKRESLSAIERGTTKPSIETVNKISELFLTSHRWLLTGEGSMYEQPQNEERNLREQLKDSNKGYSEILCRLIDESKEELQEEFDDKLETKADKAEVQAKADRAELLAMKNELRELRSIVYKENNIIESEQKDTLGVPYFTDIAAGSMRETLPHGSYSIPNHFKFLLKGIHSSYFAAKIRGESMCEIIPDGAIILMRECFAPKEDRIYLFRIENEFTLKKFGYDLEKDLPFLSYCDFSNERIYPRKGQVCYCVAEFLTILEEG